jgi:tetratricopeptide (TPR) repeat protein
VTKRYVLGIILLVTISYGCHSTRFIYHPEELHSALENQFSAEDLSRLDIPYQNTLEMNRYAQSFVRRSDGDYKNAVRLVDAIISEWDVTYERTADYTAAQVFHETRRANCLSFTHLFVSLARSVGIRAHYVEVRHDEVLSKSDLVVSSRHICAGISDGGMFYLLDFDRRPEKAYRVFRIIDDIEAVANHYNNKAINQYTLDNSLLNESLEMLDIALRIKPDFSRALNNRGVLLHLTGNIEEAEITFRRALAYDPSMHEANANLAGILLSRNAVNEALEHARLAIRTRPDNIEYQMRLAMIYFYLMDYDSAYRQFRRVTRQHPYKTPAFHGLALSAYKLGLLDDAKTAIFRAVELNPSNQQYLSFQKLLCEKTVRS